MPALPVVPALLLAALSFQLPDSEGVRHTSAEFRQSKAVVFAFVSADGPMANGYAATLARLYAVYAPRGVSFYGVDSDPEVSARRLGLPFPVLLDRRRQLARLAGAKSTPEVAVLSPAGEVLYRGRVDTLGPTLDAILAGRRVSTPTFARDVAPILYRHCAICHHPGEVAPFSLLTYQDAAKRAKLIATVTASRYMPPWQPEPGYVHFQGERRPRRSGATSECPALSRRLAARHAGHDHPHAQAFRDRRGRTGSIHVFRHPVAPHRGQICAGAGIPPGGAQRGASRPVPTGFRPHRAIAKGLGMRM